MHEHVRCHVVDEEYSQLCIMYLLVWFCIVFPLRILIAHLSCSRRIEKRKAFSRRRAHHHDSDITYINERNMQFNKKLERFYGKYTKEIKDNLERGTAV